MLFGLVENFWDDITGKTDRRKARDAKLSAADRAAKGLEGAQEKRNLAYDDASKRMDKFGNAGESALDMYMSAFGPDGEPNIYNTSMYKQQQDQLTKQLQTASSMNRMSGSDKDIQATYAPAYTDLNARVYDQYFNRLSAPIQYGYNARSMQSNIDTRRAAGEYGYGQDLANIEMGKGNIQSDYHIANANQNAGMLNSIATGAGYLFGGPAGGAAVNNALGGSQQGQVDPQNLQALRSLGFG